MIIILTKADIRPEAEDLDVKDIEYTDISKSLDEYRKATLVIICIGGRFKVLKDRNPDSYQDKTYYLKELPNILNLHLETQKNE